MHVRIVPDAGSGLLKSKRFENWRDMQKIATLMFDSLESLSSLNLAEPGGGQHGSGSTGRTGLSGLTRGGAVKPQIGNTPAQVMFTGFWQDSASNNQNHPEHQRFSGGDIYTGPATAIAHVQNPQVKVDDMVIALKTAVEAAFSVDLPGGITFSVFRIDMSGVVYGDRGYSFPRN
tara:strand:+ start:2317 stop:2841 length:525 start_codon:yes stop_codon:yes gene_type:complete